MKIIETIKIEEKIIPEHTENIEKTICDICKNESVHKCDVCKRDICKNHYYAEYNGDYPDRYCTYCYELIFKKYKDKLKQIEDKYEKELDDLQNLIKQESLNIK